MKYNSYYFNDFVYSAVTFSDPFFLCSVGIKLATRWQVNYLFLFLNLGVIFWSVLVVF